MPVDDAIGGDHGCGRLGALTGDAAIGVCGVVAGGRGARVIAAVVALLAALGVIAGCDRGGEEVLMPLGTDAPLSATTTTVSLSPKEQAAKDAEAVYRRFLKITRRIGASGGKNVTGLDEVAFGQALQDYQYAQRYYIDKGMKVAGEAPLVWLKITKASPNKVALKACIDFRGSYAIGRDGKKITDTDASGFGLDAATLIPINGEWKVSDVESNRRDSCD